MALMDKVNTFFKLIGIAIISAAIVAFLMFFAVYVFVVLLFVAVMATLAIILGVPVTIKKDGEVIGYWKYGRFYRKYEKT